MVIVQRSIIWSPHEGQNQFLAGGTELKLYEWVPEKNDSPGRARYISTIPDITLMMCADWSPDPNCSDLVAVGLTTGKTLLVRMQEHSLTDYPNLDGTETPTQGRATIYSNNNGSSSNIIKQQQQQQSQQQQQQPQQQPQPQHQKQYPSLGVKLSRTSNVVSFSKTHPHLLAAGLDKVRNDPCLLVWDVTRSLDSYCNTPTGAQTPTAFTSIRGFTQQESRASIVNQWKLDGRGGDYSEDRSKYNDMPPISTPGSASREQGPVRQYGSSEAISSCAWSEHTNAPLLIAGMGNKYLRVYDIRADPSSSPLQFLTKAVHGIVVDPFSSYRVASYTDEGIIKLWDIRKNTEPILTLNPENKYNLSKIVFSPTQPGFLASLTKDASHIDLWDIQETCSIQTAMNATGAKPAFTSTTKLEQTSSHSVLHSLMHSADDNQLSIPVLWKSRKTRLSLKNFASFAFIPPSITALSSKSYPNTHHILTVNTDGKFESIKVQEACQMSWQPTGGMMMTGKKGLLSYHPTTLSNGFEKQLSNLKLNEEVEDEENSMYTLTKQDAIPQTISFSNDRALAAELDIDISVVMRKRLLEGYSMDNTKNIKIVNDNRKLKELWSWMKIADQITPKLSNTGSVDYSHHGVYGIWFGSQGRNISSPNATPRSGNSPKISRQNQNKFRESEKLEINHDPSNSLPMVETNKLAQRQAALSACGFDFDLKSFEKELLNLESKGEYDKAAGLALFHGDTPRAIKALGSSKGKISVEEQQRKLMSAILASYHADGSKVSDTWKEICESLSEDMLDRPYLHAIFAYIASSNWYKVLDEPELPLRERIAIALRVLDDDQMTTFINRTLEKLVQEGDVEGVVVTGLTPKGVDLFEKAIDRYGDVQTASLVMSYVVPKRFKDNRVEDWVENYRLLMDRWQLWHARAKFDIQRGKRMNSSEIAPPQIYVRCNFCAQSLGHSLVIQNARNREGKRMNVQTSNPGGRVSGKQKSSVCSSCRKPLPRCALCLLHMGTPIDQLRQTIIANDTHKVDPAGFDLWFTWCQTCRHGGHAVHMFEWFQKHSTCPVSNCTCQCQL